MIAKILICVPCHNRKAVVEQCLPTIKAGLVDGDMLKLYNDGSMEYDDSWLAGLGLQAPIYSLNSPIGIEAQRRTHFREFSDSLFTHLYLTDSDALHDPTWRDTALALQAEHGEAPLCLYNTQAHVRMQGNTIEDKPSSNVIWRKFAPGISYLLTREHANRVMQQIDRHVNNWDWDVPRILGYRFAISRVSYTDHIGWGGMHHPKDEGLDGGDRALNPTPWLVEKRKEVVAALQKTLSP